MAVFGEGACAAAGRMAWRSNLSADHAASVGARWEGVKGWKVRAADHGRRAGEAVGISGGGRGACQSGTAARLELALAGVPMVTAYRVGAVEAWIVQRAIRVQSVILANLVVGENVVPEFLQQDCTPENLSRGLHEILTDSPLRRRQVEAFARIGEIMSTGNQPPSVRAADIVLAALRKSRARTEVRVAAEVGCGTAASDFRSDITCGCSWRRNRGV